MLALNLKDFEVLHSNPTILAGIPASIIDYSFTIEEQNLFLTKSYKFIGMQISAVKDGNLYTVAYFSDPENFKSYLRIVKKMIDSIKLT